MVVQKFDNEKNSGEDQSKVKVKVFHSEAEQQFSERQEEEIKPLPKYCSQDRIHEQQRQKYKHFNKSFYKQLM